MAKSICSEYRKRNPIEHWWSWIIDFLDIIIDDEKRGTRTLNVPYYRDLGAFVAKNVEDVETALALVLYKVLREARQMYNYDL
jgi:hypothetical protein